MVAADSLRDGAADGDILRQSERARGYQLIERSTVIAGDLDISCAVRFKNAVDGRGLIPERGDLAYAVLRPARRNKARLAFSKSGVTLSEVWG